MEVFLLKQEPMVSGYRTCCCLNVMVYEGKKEEGKEGKGGSLTLNRKMPQAVHSGSFHPWPTVVSQNEAFV